jgi:hypothetical protein
MCSQGLPNMPVPFLFTSMTAVIATLPMGLRVRILGRVRNNAWIITEDIDFHSRLS